MYKLYSCNVSLLQTELTSDLCLASRHVLWAALCSQRRSKQQLAANLLLAAGTRSPAAPRLELAPDPGGPRTPDPGGPRREPSDCLATSDQSVNILHTRNHLMLSLVFLPLFPWYPAAFYENVLILWCDYIYNILYIIYVLYFTFYNIL